MRAPIRRFLALLSLASLWFNLVAVPVAADGVGCPPCDRFVPLPTVPGGNVNFCIDGSWDTSPGSGQTVNDIWNATQGAVNSWNSARGSDGAAAPYTFSLNQNASCDVKIFAELPENASLTFVAGVTETRTDQGYYKLYLPGRTWNNVGSVADLQGIVAHELAHPLGLGNTYSGADPRVGTCSSRFIGSIADGLQKYPDGTWRKPTQTPQARDVDAAQRKAFNNSTCSTIPADLKTGGIPAEDVCNLDPCANEGCPGFGLPICSNLDITVEEQYPEPDYQYAQQCYSIWEVTYYYRCTGGSCEYLGSSWDYLGIVCYVY